MISAPCKDCDNHTEDCHGKCQAYKDFVRENEEQKEKIRKAKQHSARLVYMSDRQFKNSLRSSNKNRVFKQTKR